MQLLFAPIQNGIATFSTISFTQTGMQGFTALDGTLPAINSSNFNITPAVPASFKIISPSGSSIAGQDLSTVTVEVKDQFGNAVSQSPVSVSIASGPNFANLSGTLTASTDANGIATFSDLSLDRAGTYTLGFIDESIPATSAPFQIVYAGPQLVFDSEPTNIAAGGKMPKLSIAADDTRGNLLSKTAKVKVSLSICFDGREDYRQRIPRRSKRGSPDSTRSRFKKPARIRCRRRPPGSAQRIPIRLR